MRKTHETLIVPDPETTVSELFQQLAEQALRAGRADVAGDLLRRATRHKPARSDENPHSYHTAAVRLLGENRLAEAEPLLLRAIQMNPSEPLWHEHLAVLYARLRRFAEAVATFRIALSLDPVPAGRWQMLGTALTDLQDHAAAELAYREAIARRPTADLYTAAGLSCVARGQFAEAVAHFQQAAALAPRSANVHANLAAALGKLKRWEECETAARTAVALDPNLSSGWSNLGNCLRDLGRFEEAGAALARAVQLEPDNADAAGHYALTLAAVGRHADALPWYDCSLTLKPDNDEVRFNRSLTRLTLGDWPAGWAEYDLRWQTDALKGKEPTFPQPRWAGEPLTGKAIVLTTEQGLGDYIQFIRFAKPLADRGATVIVQPPPELVELVRTVPGVGTVIDRPAAEATFHTHCPLLSVPGVLQVGLSDLSGEPYLTAPAGAVAKWRERLADVPGFQVGIVWQGNPKHTGDRWRSVKLSQFAPLAAVPGVTLVSVQKGHGRDQLSEATFPVLDVGDELTDLADTAGLLKNLDLLISIDSAVAHLAGALGVRVWTAVAFNNDWRWLQGRTDTPWYHSMTLFRQPQVGDWAGAFADLERGLREAVQSS